MNFKIISNKFYKVLTRLWGINLSINFRKLDILGDYFFGNMFVYLFIFFIFFNDIFYFFYSIGI